MSGVDYKHGAQITLGHCAPEDEQGVLLLAVTATEEASDG